MPQKYNFRMALQDTEVRNSLIFCTFYNARQGDNTKQLLPFLFEKIFHQRTAFRGKHALGYPGTRMQHR